jgi:hypothetical protein
LRETPDVHGQEVRSLSPCVERGRLGEVATKTETALRNQAAVTSPSPRRLSQPLSF